MVNVRKIVFEILLEVDKKPEFAGSLCKDTLDKYAYLDKQQRAFIHYLADGVIERKITLDYVIDSFSTIPARKMKPPVRCLIRMGAYQILYMDSVPNSAACNESVKLAKEKHLGNLAGFVNGVLRKIAGSEGGIKYPNRAEDAIEYLSVFYSMPRTVVESFTADYGAKKCEKILDGLAALRPLIVRVNNSKAEPDKVLSGLNEIDDVSAKISTALPYAIVFEKIDVITDIDMFNEGLFTVQDISSMLVCHIAGIKGSDTVLDVCASPGGKSMHAADIIACASQINRAGKEGRVISCDVSEKKINRMRENIERCGFDNVSLMIKDATVKETAFEKCADVLLADVPCSGLGVIGRKVDLRYAVTKEGLDSIVGLQRNILDNIAGYVKDGGVMIYSTCTVRCAENEKQVEYLCENHGFEVVDFYDDLPDEFKTESAHHGMLQIFPGEHESDGFFIAKLRKCKKS